MTKTPTLSLVGRLKQRALAFRALKRSHKEYDAALDDDAAAEIARLTREVEMLSDAVIPSDPDEDSDGTLCSRNAFLKWCDQRDRATAAERELKEAREVVAGVIAVADRDTPEFRRARSFLAALGEKP